jgi:hypothetical protein
MVEENVNPKLNNSIDDITGTGIEEENKGEQINMDMNIEVVEVEKTIVVKVTPTYTIELGRLKRNLDVICPECGESKMQLRAIKMNCIEDGEEVVRDREFKYCPVCEFRLEDKTKKKQNRTKFVDEEEVFNGKNNNKRNRTSSGNGRNNRTSYR